MHLRKPIAGAIFAAAFAAAAGAARAASLIERKTPAAGESLSAHADRDSLQREGAALARVGLTVDDALTRSLFGQAASPELETLAANPQVQVFLQRAREAREPEGQSGFLKFMPPKQRLSGEPAADSAGPSALELLHSLRDALGAVKTSDLRQAPAESLDAVAKAAFDKALMTRPVPINPVVLEHTLPPEVSPSLRAIQEAADPPPGPAWLGRFAREPEETRTPGRLFKAILTDFDVLLIGEDHNSLSSLPLLYNTLPALKSQRAAIGLENMHNIPMSDKAEFWMGDVERNQQAMALWNSAVQNDVPFAGLDLSRKEVERRYRQEMARRARRGLATTSMDLIYEVIETFRNRFMARRLKLNMQAKGVALAGVSHIKTVPQVAIGKDFDRLRYRTLADALVDRGLRPFSLVLTGGRILPGADAAKIVANLKVFYERALLGNPDGRMIFRLTSPDTGILHLGGTPFRENMIHQKPYAAPGS